MKQVKVLTFPNVDGTLFVFAGEGPVGVLLVPKVEGLELTLVLVVLVVAGAGLAVKGL